MVSRPLRPPNGCPLAYPRQILDGDTEIVPCGLLNNGLANIVVYPGLEAGLATFDLSQPALCGFCPNRLKDCATTLVPLTLSLKLFAREHFTVACDCQRDYAEINSEPPIGIVWIGGLDLATLVQEEHAVSINEIGLPQAIFKHFPLVLTANELDMQTSLDRPDRDLLFIFGFPREDALIVGDSTQGLEDSLALVVKFVGVGDAGDSPHDNLRGEIGKLLSSVVIGKFVQGVLPEYLGFPGALAQMVAGLVGAFNGALQRIGLLFSWLEFDLRNQFHGFSIAQFVESVKYGKEAGRLLPTACGGVSVARLL